MWTAYLLHRAEYVLRVERTLYTDIRLKFQTDLRVRTMLEDVDRAHYDSSLGANFCCIASHAESSEDWRTK
jgi:hypothetical protein